MISRGRVAALLFGSGAATLIYQTAWLRELRFVFGASTAASAAVLAVFMGGLGAGGLLLGRRAARHARPLKFYAGLELGVTIAAAGSPLLIAVVRRVYVSIGGTLALGAVGGTALRLALTGMVLLVPTLLAGGTLPAATQAVERGDDAARRATGLLYGANTLGALAGCVLSTFVLHELLGVRKMLFAACLLNAAVALVAWRWARKTAPAPIVVPKASEAVREDAPRRAPVRERAVRITAALVGFVFLLMEIVWYRMLAPVLGGSSYTFGLILAIVLLGIAAGGLWYARGHRRPATGVGVLALTCALEAVAIALPFALGDDVALWALRLRLSMGDTFRGLVGSWTAIAALVVFPAAFISGYQFPLLVASLDDGRRVGEQVGAAYAWNTAGAIGGSLVGGFGILPLLSAPGVWRLAVCILAVGAIGLLGIARDEPRRWVSRAALAAAAVALVLIATPGPTGIWRHGGVGVGRAPAPSAGNLFTVWRNLWRRSIVWERDGIEGTVALATDLDTAFILNGKSDGSARNDAGTQVMSGLIATLIHPAPRRSLVIGLGTGTTAGWLAAIPMMERVDVFELEPIIAEVARAFTAVNHDALANPKVHLTLGDARELLLTTKATYDVIFSEPSNPYRSGISSLFTRELYEAAATRLDRAGLFVQWMQSYEVDYATVATVFATLRSVYPYVETWSTRGGDLLLIASRIPIPHDLATLRERVGQTPYRDALYSTWRVDDVEGVLAHYVAPPSVADAFLVEAKGALSTDDHTLVEFGFARSVGRPTEDNVEALRRATTDSRPSIDGGVVDWQAVEDRRLTMHALNGLAAAPPPSAPVAVHQRAAALDCWVMGDLACVLQRWGGQDRPPQDPLEQLILAEALADAGHAEAPAQLGTLRQRSPVEADVLEARYQLRAGAPEAAADAIVRGLEGYRRDPWPLMAVMKRALRLVPEVARRAPAARERIAAALAQPFAAALLDSARRGALLDVTLLAADSSRCVEILAPLEPYVPWTPSLLESRARCYREHPSRWRDRARADLFRYSQAQKSAVGAAEPVR